MDPYLVASQAASRAVMTAYSTSFGLASRFFPPATRQAIYDIYGLVRLADEIVDTYAGPDRATQLDALEQETYTAFKRGYSTNLIVHAFQHAATTYSIDKTLIEPFFASMRLDLAPDSYEPSMYATYIHGSAEVIGLMCLKVFCDGDDARYQALQPGAQALGAAFQKVNFLRDLAADHRELGRYYFPVGSFETFDDETKRAICQDIRLDFQAAKTAIDDLSPAVRRPVRTAYVYYLELFDKLEAMPAAKLKTDRPRINDARKIYLLLRTRLGR